MFDAYMKMWKNYAVFNGRSTRSEYWYPFLINIIIISAINILVSFFNVATRSIIANPFSLISSLYSLASFIPGLALTVRRLHDVNKNGAYVLFGLIPIVGAILLIVWLATDSYCSDNIYGKNPKDIGNHPEKQSYTYTYQQQPTQPQSTANETVFCTNCGKQIQNFALSAEKQNNLMIKKQTVH